MKTQYIWLTIAVVAVIIAAGAKMGLKNETPIQDTPIKIGTIMSETGIAAEFGMASRRGAELAVKEINAQGGINGRSIELVLGDDMTDPLAALGLYKKLTSIDKVNAIIGSNFDFTVQPVFDEAREGTTVVITPTAARIPGSLETNAMSFSMLVDFDRIVGSLEAYMASSSYERVGVVHYSSGFGQQITATLRRVADKNGKEFVTNETYTDFGTTDWQPYILKLKRDSVDLVFLDMLGDDLLRFTDEAAVLGYEATFITHNDIINVLKKANVNVGSLEGVVVLNWDVQGSEAFREAFVTEYGVQPINYAAQSYQSVCVLMEAIREGGTNDIAKTLEKDTFRTPFGEFSFDEHHSARQMPIKVQVVQGRELVELYAIE